MKKALIVLLILAVAGGVFAQTWSGEVTTGAWIRLGDDFDDPIVYAANDDDFEDGAAVTANVGATYDRGNWGFKVVLDAAIGGEGDGGAAFSFPNAYGWMKFLDSIIDVKAGLIDDGVWSTGGYIDDGLSTGLGIRVEVTPIDGLNLGVFFSYPDNDYPFAAGKIVNFFKEMAFGFQFDGGIFEVSAAMKLYSEESAYTGYVEDEIDAALTAGFGFHGIDIVDIYLGVWIDYLMGDPEMEITLAQNFDFNVIDGLGLHLELAEFFCDGLQWVSIKPSADFGLGDGWSVGGSVPLLMDTDAEDNLGFASLGLNAWVMKEIGGAWMKAGYGFTNLMKDYGDSLNHYIKLVFGYSF